MRLKMKPHMEYHNTLSKKLVDISQKKKNKQPINIEKIDQLCEYSGTILKTQNYLRIYFSDKKLT